MNINSLSKCVVGVDISIETTTLGIVDIRGNILGTDHFPTQKYPTESEFITALANHILNLVEQHGGYENIRSIGVSAPNGNFVTGCVENPANLKWHGIVPLAVMLRDRVGLAVAVGNDAHTTALGEYVYAGAHGMKNFIVITVGHGVGSCMFVDGKARLGNGGFAGEIGHTVLIDGGRVCGCGQHGCLEAYCGEKGVLATAREVMDENPDTPTKMREIENMTPKDISMLCDEGDKLAQEVFRRTGYYLGWGIANYASVVNPEAVIVSGGISLAGHWLLDPMRESFEQHVFRNVRGHIKIEQSMLEDHERDILGASALAWEVPEYSLFK